MDARPLASYQTLHNYAETVRLLRAFFVSKGFLEVDTQSRRSILAACEDPTTIATYTFGGLEWPLPQTGQMWLEHDMLENRNVPGLFCLTTSYRNEPNPISERHLTIFPMFEFESHGTQDDLQLLLEELFEYIGFGPRTKYAEGEYDEIAMHYNTPIIGAVEEAAIEKDFSHVFFLKNFPLRSNPFWNMRQHDGKAKKIDVIAYGIETVGSAERSCNPEEMRSWFYAISDGQYSQLLFEKFGRDRVEKELDTYLAFDFFPRFGAGIGIHRMVRARELAQRAHPELRERTYRSATLDFGTL
jgi:aspartyl/asparaginyl-tRNA synthetase